MNNALSSLALLKLNWDHLHRDYIENFIPFVEFLFATKKYPFIEVNVVCTDFKKEFDLDIPYHAMLAILDRATARDLLFRRKSDRKFVPNYEKISADDFVRASDEQKTKYEKIISLFTEYCRTEYRESVDNERAHSILIGFLKEHDLDILFLNENKETILPAVDAASDTENYLINSFVKTLYETASDNFSLIVDISIGHIIANTLLCEHYDEYRDSLKKCTYYLDIAFLFNIFGISGDEKKRAFDSCLLLMKSKGARLFVFSHTCEEFINILEGCIVWLDSRAYDISRANRALTFFIENGWTSSSVEQLILSVDDTLKASDISKVDTPDPMADKDYQINESALQDVIAETYGDREPLEHTILLDIKSIAAIYKLRRGNRPKRMSEASHVLITANNGLALASKRFDKEQYRGSEFCIPSTLTDVFIATIIWINSPAASIINKQRLIANAYAAINPSRQMLKKLVEIADVLKKNGHITDEQVILLKESRMSKSLLMRITVGDIGRFTDKTAFEILEEIKKEVSKSEREEHLKVTGKLSESIKKRDDKIELLNKKYEIVKAQLKQIETIKTKLDERVERRGAQIKWCLAGLNVVLWAAWGVLKFYYKFQDIDIFPYLAGVATIFQYVYFAFSNKQFNPFKIYENYLANKRKKTYVDFGFEIESYVEMKQKEEALAAEITSIPD